MVRRRRGEGSRSFIPSLFDKSNVFQPLDRSEDERKRELGARGMPLALLRQRVIARPFLRSFQKPREAYTCNTVSSGFHQFLFVRPIIFPDHNKIN